MMFVRYTDQAHAHMAEALGMGEVVVRPTYEDASEVAREQVMRDMARGGMRPVTVMHTPHRASADPFDAFGSWGWK